ncbi:hypothetical protein [Mesorhizobium sp. A623]
MPDTDAIAIPEAPYVPCLVMDDDHLAVHGRNMWLGDPFHVLPADEWDA